MINLFGVFACVGGGLALLALGLFAIEYLSALCRCQLELLFGGLVWGLTVLIAVGALISGYRAAQE